MPRSTHALKNSDAKPVRAEASQDVVPPKEALLFTVLDEVVGDRVLCTSLSRGQFASAVADRLPNSEVSCFFLDVFLAKQARDETNKMLGEIRDDIKSLIAKVGK